MSIAVKPLYEWGHECLICDGRHTIHEYRGPQLDRDGTVAFHLWNCRECGATVKMESPEEYARRWARIQIRRMRQRRRARRYG